jgi:hypothetical protein
MLVQALVGAVIAVSLLVLIRDHDRSRRIWSFGLVVATLIYVGFAAAAGESLPRELLGVGIFLPFAAAGWRGSNLAVAAGWAGHVAWDVALHAGGTVAPAWYPGLCIGFDLAVAVWFVWRERGLRTAFNAPVT